VHGLLACAVARKAGLLHVRGMRQPRRMRQPRSIAAGVEATTLSLLCICKSAGEAAAVHAPAVTTTGLTARLPTCVQIVERFTAHYVFALGLSRFFSCAHWLLQVRMSAQPTAPLSAACRCSGCL
jgi:hypothetical protein